MRYLTICLLLFLASGAGAQIERPIGINLTGVRDWSTEFGFTDAMKHARAWISFNADGSGPWDSQVSVPLDDRGYPLALPYDDGVHPPQALRTLVLWDIQPYIPSGLFRFQASGTGVIRLRFGANGTFSCPVDTLIPVNNGVAIEILSSNASDPVRDIRFVYPKYADTYTEKTFTDEFLGFLADFQTIRFMDWLATNFSPVASWDDRARPDHFTQALDNGVAWEYVVQLCNETGKDAWINIPHQADDHYIQQLADLLHTGLDPKRKIYLEYSNEVWNGIFSQHQYAGAQGLLLGYSGPEWERAYKYTARRSADIFHIFENTFSDDERLVKILPAQAAGSWWANQLAGYFLDPQYNPYGVKADALAVAPYFGGNVADDIAAEGLVSSITLPEIMDRIEAGLPTAFGYIDDSKTVADNYDLRLLVYEGGQHVVATGNNVNNDELTQKLIAANRHPRMQDAYCQYFDYWYEQVGDAFMHFSSHGLPSKWGSWGVKEHMDDLDNPKYLGLKNCVFAYNTSIGVESASGEIPEVQAFPNPSADGYFELRHAGDWTPAVAVTDLAGRAVGFELLEQTGGRTLISIRPPGMYVVTLQSSEGKVSFRVFTVR